jgi:hypothetical protein
MLLIVVHRSNQTMQDRDNLSHAEPQRRKERKKKMGKGEREKDQPQKISWQ